MKITLLAMLALGACTYNLDTSDLRAKQASLEQSQSEQAARIAELERKQAEQDGKLRVLFHGGGK